MVCAEHIKGFSCFYYYNYHNYLFKNATKWRDITAEAEMLFVGLCVSKTSNILMPNVGQFSITYIGSAFDATLRSGRTQPVEFGSTSLLYGP